MVPRAGIIGLTSALKIQQLLSERDSSRSTDVLLVAREWPTSIPGAPIQHSADYASMWAGAHVRPIPGSTPQLRREAKWLKQTMVEFKRHLESDPSAGISQVPGVEYLGTSPPEYEEQDAETFTRESGLLGYRKYADSELPEGIRFGFEYQTYCVNSPLYCGNLLRKFILHGGQTLQRDIKSPWEPYSWGSHIKAVINASGVGFGDPKCYPIRGSLYYPVLIPYCHFYIIRGWMDIVNEIHHRSYTFNESLIGSQDYHCTELGWVMELRYPSWIQRRNSHWGYKGHQ